MVMQLRIEATNLLENADLENILKMTTLCNRIDKLENFVSDKLEHLKQIENVKKFEKNEMNNYIY
jgi:NifU-like protein involved in Fe-S cluster formation